MSTAAHCCGNADTVELIRFLQCPSTYPDEPSCVEVVETHISWVFLSRRYAYKLKKPVRFDFLDFSTPQLRRAACENEVRLNRRLAPNVYLGVTPITLGDHGFFLDGKDPPVDWLVKMRKLPKDRSLDVLIRNHAIGEKEIPQVSAVLTDFYRRLPPVPARTDSYLLDLERHIRGNRDELLQPVHELDPALVNRAHARQLRMLRLAPEMFRSRVLDGRIVEGHGDLRPEHIYLEGAGPSVIDCIEFNREFRILDVVDELSFLAVECTFLGAKGIGGQILDSYCRTSGDIPPKKLLSFYMCYRACVRAKVQAIRAAQVSSASQQRPLRLVAQQYLQLADEYARELGPPLLLIVRGLMGTGKSTLASALQQSLDIELLQTDALRHELLGSSDQPVQYGEEHYSWENRLAVYEEMLRRAESMLAKGRSVILDGTFLTRALRARAASLARRHQAIPVVIHCRCPDELASQRIAARLAQRELISEARPELLEQQKREEESDPPGLCACEIDTRASVPEMTKAVLQHLHAAITD